MSDDPTPADADTTGLPVPGNESNPDRNGTPATQWARVVELEREVRFLSAKCDELRHSCRDLLAAIGPPGPFTDEQVHSIESDPPTRSREEVYAEYWRLRKEAAAGLPAPPTAPFVGRFADLERQRDALAARRAELRVAFLALINVVDPFVMPTEEEVRDMMEGPRGRSILEIIEEYERELGGRAK